MNSTKKNVTVRKQKIRKNHIRGKLLFFSALVVILLIAAALARHLCPYDPYAQDLSLSQLPPSINHILGTDRYGRDMFSRVIAGSRISIYGTLFIVFATALFGTATGILCGMKGGTFDSVLMRICSLPFLRLCLLLLLQVFSEVGYKMRLLPLW